MTAEPVAYPILLSGDDGHLYVFPRPVFDGYRRPAGEAAAATDDPTFTGPDGSIYVFPRAEVEGYRMSDEQQAALRIEPVPEAEVTGFESPCPPGWYTTVTSSPSPGRIGTVYRCTTFDTYQSFNSTKRPAPWLSIFR